MTTFCEFSVVFINLFVLLGRPPVVVFDDDGDVEDTDDKDVDNDGDAFPLHP